MENLSPTRSIYPLPTFYIFYDKNTKKTPSKTVVQRTKPPNAQRLEKRITQSQPDLVVINNKEQMWQWTSLFQITEQNQS